MASVRQSIVPLLIFIVATLIFLGWMEMTRERYNFELVVEVDTPQGLQKGSSIYEVKAWNTVAFLPDEARRMWEVHGEAVAIDLPNSRTLFTLMRTETDHRDLAGMSMMTLDPAYRNDVVESAARIAARKGVYPAAEIDRADYPVMVTFEDKSKPGTVMPVATMDLEKVFGPGYRIRRMYTRITDASLTDTIEKRLPWLSEYRHCTLARNRYGRMENFADSLRPGDFSTELHRRKMRDLRLGPKKKTPDDCNHLQKYA